MQFVHFKPFEVITVFQSAGKQAESCEQQAKVLFLNASSHPASHASHPECLGRKTNVHSFAFCSEPTLFELEFV